MKRKAKKRSKKSYGLRIHAKRRLKSRYGLVLNSEGYKNIIGKIIHGDSELVRVVSNARTIHKVSVEGIDVIVVYDKNRHELVTALPKCYNGKRTNGNTRESNRSELEARSGEMGHNEG